jgi:hypothetical protein
VRGLAKKHEEKIMRKILSIGILAGVLGAASAGRAAVIADYDFTSSTTAASVVAANVLASGLSFGTSVNSPTSSNDFYASKPVLSISRKDDTAAQVYVQTTITAAPGFELNLDSFTFDGAKGGASDPRTYEVHSSVGGLAISSDPSAPGQVLASGQFTATRGAAGSSATLPTITSDLSAPAYDHLSALTVRIYFFTPTVSQNIDIDNLTFNGSVVPVAVPEPGSASCALALAIGALGRRRR